METLVGIGILVLLSLGIAYGVSKLRKQESPETFNGEAKIVKMPMRDARGRFVKAK